MSGNLPLLLAQDSDNGAAMAMLFFFVLIEVALLVLLIVGQWKVFVKAGEPGWACIVPFYNLYVMLRIAGRPGWWLVLAFIPCVSLILLVIPFDIAGKFGKGIGFGFGLLFLPFIFYPILAFGDARYQGSPGSP